MDLYGHVLPGGDTESVSLADAFLARAKPRQGLRRPSPARHHMPPIVPTPPMFTIRGSLRHRDCHRP